MKERKRRERGRKEVKEKAGGWPMSAPRLYERNRYNLSERRERKEGGGRERERREEEEREKGGRRKREREGRREMWERRTK